MGVVLSIIAIVLLVIALTGDDGDDSDSETAAPATSASTTTAAPSITVITPEVPPAPEPTPETVPPAPEPEFPEGFPTPEQWQAFRQCQTGGDYSAVNEAGTNFGAYQFRAATWDELAGRRFPELVGVLPSEASPADQDKMGFALWEERGATPWPDCAYTISDVDQPSQPAAEAEPAPAPAPAVDYDPNALGPAVAPVVANFPSPAQWQAFRNCQTGGDYTVVSPSGTNFGAYQFRAATWDELAGRLFPSLVGVLPSQASPADQDRMAYAFWQENGVARWPGCGFHLEPETAATDAAATAADTIAGGSLIIEPPSLPPITGTSGSAPPADTATAPAASASVSSVSTTPSVPTAQQWENLRQCESWGDYTIVSRNGLYYGAYQFEIRTWDDVASRHAPQLVGTLPSEASPQQQDFLAQKLYDERGWQPWPVCGALHLA